MLAKVTHYQIPILNSDMVKLIKKTGCKTPRGAIEHCINRVLDEIEGD